MTYKPKKWQATNIFIKANKEIDYESHVLNAPMSLDNIIFLIDNKYQINTDKKILRNVLT